MIRLIWPTIRPLVAHANAQKWITMATDQSQLELWFGVNSDADRNALANAEWRTPLVAGTRFCLLKDARPGVTHTVTQMTRTVLGCTNPDKEIFVLASDDFQCQPGWDEHIRNQYSCEWQGALICNDGYKKGTNIIPLPILSGACLKRLNGVVYSPWYHHYFSDQEFYDIVTELGLTRDLRGTPAPEFKHLHWSFRGRQKDEFDVRNDRHFWADDHAAYQKRKAMPVEEKLQLPAWYDEAEKS